jgi:hypothetical protein
MVTDMSDLAELQRVISEKDARIAALEAELQRLRPAPLIAALDGPYVVPSPAETARLIDITLSAYPKLRSKACDHERLIRSVRHCISFIGTINRLPVGTTESKYRERWSDRCQQWIVQQGVSADVNPLTFCIAVICSGDVDFIDPNSVGNGGVMNYSLTDGVGRKPKNGWLLVLQNNKPREPLAPPMVNGDWRPTVRHLPQGNERYLPGRVDSF